MTKDSAATIRTLGAVRADDDDDGLFITFFKQKFKSDLISKTKYPKYTSRFIQYGRSIFIFWNLIPFCFFTFSLCVLQTRQTSFWLSSELWFYWFLSQPLPSPVEKVRIIICSESWIPKENKKVLLREPKRHTAACLSTRGGATFPGRGVPSLAGGTFSGGGTFPGLGVPYLAGGSYPTPISPPSRPGQGTPYQYPSIRPGQDTLLSTAQGTSPPPPHCQTWPGYLPPLDLAGYPPLGPGQETPPPHLTWLGTPKC